MANSLKGHIHHLDKRLRFRLRIYFLISAILLLILIFNIIRGALRLDLGILGLIIGIIIGVISSRMFHISWSNDAEKVVSRFDRFGIIVLVLYILLELSREKIINYFTQGFEVGTIGFAVLAGIMIGRLIGTRGKIIQILKDQKIFG